MLFTSKMHTVNWILSITCVWGRQNQKTDHVTSYNFKRHLHTNSNCNNTYTQVPLPMTRDTLFIFFILLFVFFCVCVLWSMRNVRSLLFTILCYWLRNLYTICRNFSPLEKSHVRGDDFFYKYMIWRNIDYKYYSMLIQLIIFIVWLYTVFIPLICPSSLFIQQTISIHHTISNIFLPFFFSIFSSDLYLI